MVFESLRRGIDCQQPPFYTFVICRFPEPMNFFLTRSFQAGTPSALYLPPTSITLCRYTQYLEFASLSLVNLPMVGSYPLPVSALRLVLYEDAPPPTPSSASTSSLSSSSSSMTSPPSKSYPTSSSSSSVLSPLPSSASFYSPTTTTTTTNPGAPADRSSSNTLPASYEEMVGTRQYLTGKAKVREGASKSSTKVGDIANGKVSECLVCVMCVSASHRSFSSVSF